MNLNITEKYSKYSKINSRSNVKVCVDDELYIENCNISYKNENNMRLNNISFENIKIEDNSENW
ncbi:hypothetical protein ACTFJW_02155 [Clostridium cagae]|uniref:hypothetical protein n=1 Tax=Clostridium TaxID=1485 RepID=UPI0020798D60|nr:hypothetical protein [Clostridium sp. ZBS12]